MSFFKISAVILFYFASRMVFTFGSPNENAFNQDATICLNQVDKTGGPVCVASAD
jgi:hypothetical protein